MEITLGSFRCPFAPWRLADGRIFDRFSYDTETTNIDDDRPYLTPIYVIGAACDGRRGVFLTRDNLLPFFEAHAGASMMMHNAAFDLRVTAPLLQPRIDIYQAVEENRVWDTMILKRLLSLATAGHTAFGKESSLHDCAHTHLGVGLKKDQTDAHGKNVRTSFGQFLGRLPAEIPAQYLTYLGQDALATYHLFGELHRLIKEVLQRSRGVWGYVSDDWLRDVVRRFGPLTHHVQLRSSILMDVLRNNGIGVCQTRRDEKELTVRALADECKERLRRRGYLVGEKGSAKALQSILDRFHREHPDIELKRTESGKQWSKAEDDLAELAGIDPFFCDYSSYSGAQKLLAIYLNKMGPARIHSRFNYLLVTGRTSCSGFTLQNLPNEKEIQKVDLDAATIRGCFVPGEGNVFIDSDYGQIELVVLGHAIEKQFGLRSELARLINEENDVHRLIAATVLGKDLKEVTKSERNSAKPVSFGRPGGMGVRGLRQIARSSYGIEFSDEEVQRRIDAYHTLCPELDAFLADEVDTGSVIAAELQLTPAQYCQAVNKYHDPLDAKNHVPEGWLGGMLLKVLRDKTPITQNGRSYTSEEIEFFWGRAQHLRFNLEPQLAAKLRSRQADKRLWEAVRNGAGRRSVFTVTGRLRANATFCSSRNNIFQGVAADGAILGLWFVWRAGHKIVSFVHDQLVVESPADDRVKDRFSEIELLMKKGMAQVVPGMLVKVETVVTASLNKQDLDPRYDPKTKEWIHWPEQTS